MKKQLLYGTAFVAAAILAAGGAVAADKKAMKPSISVNGFHNVIIGGFLDENDDAKPNDTAAADVRTNSEILFNGRTTLDSGIKIHARAELETSALHANSDIIDEYFLSVSGSFGQITVGALGGVADKMLGAFTGTGVGVGAHPHFDNWFNNAGNASTYISLDDGDAEKINYVSPSFGGFQVGLTYSPQMGEELGAKRTDADNTLHDGLAGAARYTGKFGDVGFGVGTGMYLYQGAKDAMNSEGEANPEDMSAWLVGGYLDFGGGFRVAAAHKQVTDDNKAARGTTTDVGVRYIQGAHRFSIVGVFGEMKNSDATRSTVVGGYGRSLGPGVVVHADLFWTASQSDETAETAQTEADGLALLTGIKVSF